MGRLKPELTSAFKRDVKRLDKKHVDDRPLEEVIDLILENSSKSIAELKRHHDMHTLSGSWRGSSECHVANAGDWLLIWRTTDELAVFQRTGSHDELFR